MKKMTGMLSLGLTLGTLTMGNVAFAGGAGAPAAKPPMAMAACKTITDLLGSDPQFSTLLTAVQAAGLEDTLRGGSYTVFAPTNAAFAKVPSDALSALLNDTAALKAVLLYHVVPGKVSAKQVMGMKAGKTANGANVSVRVMGGKVMINGATVIKADVMACNGIVHVIDTVLMPPMAAAPAMAPAPVAAAPAPAPMAAPAAAEFNVTNIPVTPQPRTSPVPAPVVAAPAAPATTDTTTTTATTTDTTATTTTTDTTATATTTDMTVSNSIYDVISTDERFSTLANLLSDAGLDVTLMSGEYTVFAPTNDAFAKLDDNTLAVLSSDTELLKKVLLYHVVSGKVPASQVLTSTQLASAEGSSLNVMVSGSTVMVGQGTVVATDIATGNGVIHAIDTVLLPPDVTIPAPVAIAADTSATVTTTTTATTTAAPATANAGAATAVNYTFKHNPITADPNAAGTAVATLTGTDVTTVLTLTGLTPGMAYISHYHAYGTGSSTDPCASNGPVTVGFPNFSADASGKATVTLVTPASKIEGDAGAYINVHYASDPSVVPICAPVRTAKS
ncbi:fasciclin domain-containing protein [Deinococcus radiomollis]|uniref:fasciclin domain-containing protein n=1 Tax=Deinococcus radiomollis TaxID=468916 RepID=UPI003891A0F4